MPTLSANVICVYIYDISLRIKRFRRMNRTFEAFFRILAARKLGRGQKKWVEGEGGGGARE